MKKLNYILSLTLVVIFLSSCGSLSISQKRYSNGLNFDWFSSKDDAKDLPQLRDKKRKSSVAETPVEETVAVDDFVMAEDAPGNDEVITTIIDDVVVSEVPANSESKKSKKKSLRSIYKDQKAQQKQLLKDLKQDFKASKNVNKSTNSSNESQNSDNILILIIIAIFIPPLAVFLYYGAAETHFWINLLLWLLFGGIGFSSGYGILGVGIAFIHALLVLFGILG